MPFVSSLVLSIFLHSVLVLWLIGSAWLLSRMQPHRLSSYTVFLGGDSPLVIDQVPGEGGGVKQEPAVQAEADAEPAVEKFAPPVEKPPPPQSAVERPLEAVPPKPIVERTVPPPPKPMVEKPVPPTPAPKPVVERALAVPPKPPPEAMTLAQKETKPTPPAPPTATATEGQQAVAQLRQRQAEQERTAQAAQQRVASLRAEQAEQQAAQQRVAELRARVSSGASGETSGPAASGTGSGLPGGGRGTGTAGAGGLGTGGLSGIRLHTYETLVQKKVYDAWSVPPQSKGLHAVVFLIIDRTGRIEQLRFIQKSGNALFDDSLQRAIKKAEPLPPLPEDYTGRFLEAELRFRPLD